MKLGAYQLIRQIAQGGIADIYLAKAKNAAGIDKYLVCKCIRNSITQDNQFLTSIINEAQICVHLRHPNILEVFDLCYCDNSAFLTMEYLDAQDLHCLIADIAKKNQQFPIEAAIYIISQAALGLQAAHDLTLPDGRPTNLVHRDISPENILFASDGSIKIADFGIAKTSQMPDITPQDEIKGKFNYMSPEQAWGDRVDSRSDIFSLAVVLYETITGVPLYPTTSIADTIQHARTACFAKPRDVRPDIPQDLEDILLKALDLDKAERYQTAREFKQALDNCAAANGYTFPKAQWIDFLNLHAKCTNPPLPRMHAGEIVPDKSSVLKPAVASASATEDLNATGQASSEMVAELVRIAATSGAMPITAVENALSSTISATLTPATPATVVLGISKNEPRDGFDMDYSDTIPEIDLHANAPTPSILLPTPKHSKLLRRIIITAIVFLAMFACMILIYIALARL